jgi:porin
MDLPILRIVSVLRLAIVLATLTIAQTLPAQDPDSPSPEIAIESVDVPTSIYQDTAQFGGPTSVGGQLAEDATVVPQFRMQRLQDVFDPWYCFKERLNECVGLQFNIDESILYQTVTDSLGENDAASGLVRIFGQWELLARGSGHPGFLVYKGEHRHRIGSAITPFDLGFEAGSIVPTGTFFSEFTFSVTNLYWKQYFFDRNLAVAIGRIDVTDFVDVYALMNPLTHFLNLSFSSNPSIAFPNQGLGAAAGGMLTEHMYVQGGFGDANGQPTLAGFDTFFDDAEFFSYFEAGLTTSKDRIYLDNVHVTLWHVDPREVAATPEGWGMAFTVQKYICDKWLPFFRFGYSDGDAALMQTVFSTGIGLRRENNDVAGIGFSWGAPADGTLRDQFTSEFFYRFQLTQFLAITPDVQLIVDPALNPTVDVLAFAGIRLRASF